LFGKRPKCDSLQYANIEISYLHAETQRGAILAANHARPDGFTHRLQFVDFAQRSRPLRIWKTLFPMDVPREADIDLMLLARRFKLAGGNIRNILVTAAYLAASNGRAVNMAHLLHGTRRELQKMGRLIGEEDLGKA
jgi:hypothetical protein